VRRGLRVSDLAHDTLALADWLELDDFHLLGVSLGGAIAQEVALAAPARVRTLTLAMTWGGDGHWGRVRGRLMANAALRTPPEEHVEQLLHSCLSEELFEDPDRVARFRRMMLDNPYPQSVRRQAQAVGRHEARDRLGDLGMPVHVVAAERYLMVPVWKSRELAELIPHARLAVIERGTHAVNMERAEEFNRAVLDFLTEHTAAAAGQRASASERTTAS
jgi:pimeloyl-ACP methyl ester carboxylesterase